MGQDHYTRRARRGRAGSFPRLEKKSCRARRADGIAHDSVREKLAGLPAPLGPTTHLQVWRQLWRVVERSDMLVQIVDARNPLLFYSEDVSRYVTEVDPRKKNLLLVNKADMLGKHQR